MRRSPTVQSKYLSLQWKKALNLNPVNHNALNL